MGATAAHQLASDQPDFLTYFLTGDGAATTTTVITCSNAGPGADLISDLAAVASVREGFGRANPLSQVIRCQQDGLGSVVAVGAPLTQAQARQLFNSDGNLAFGNIKTPRLRIIVTPRSGVAAWSCDVNVDGGGLPIIEFTTSAAAGTWLLRVEVATPRR